MSGELGKASLDLTADTTGLDRGRASVDEMDGALDALAAVAKIAEDALAHVKMSSGQAAESKVSAEAILSGVRGISEESILAARELGKVKLTAANVAETEAAGDAIDTKLKEINRNAGETRRSLDRVRLAGGRNGAGVGPIGSGFGRVGVLGTAIGAGILTAPAAGPALGGLLASIPTFAAGGIGALGTLALAFDGVTKAIGGDKKAFDSLGPSAKQFTLTVRSLSGWFDKLRETAGSSLFPGLTAGLKSALSPGTVSAITKAIQEFGTAIGQAGAAWGRYFGSAEFQQIFGPLMHAGAHNLSIMAGAALSLFDALGVLGRAAIPLTTWITQSIADGAKLADNWLHAKDATGQLSGAMTEAKTSLQLVGGLVESLFSAVGQLGIALYPVSKVAVKDLTDGLNALAKIIKDNQQGIRNIVQGALSAFVATVKGATPIVKTLASALSAVVHAVGGWKTAFEGLFALGIALKLAPILVKVLSIGSAFKAAAVKATAAATVIEGETVAIGGAATVAEGEVLGLRAALLGLGAPEVLAAIAAAAAAYAGFKLGQSLRGKPNNGGYGTPAADAAAARNKGQWVDANGNPVDPALLAKAERKGLDGTQQKVPGGTIVWRDGKPVFYSDKVPKPYIGGNPAGDRASFGSGSVQELTIAQYNALAKKNGFAAAPDGTSDPYNVVQTGAPGATRRRLNLKLPQAIARAITAAQAGHGDLDKANAAAYAFYENLLNNPALSGAQKQAIYQAEEPYAPSKVFGTPKPFTKNLGPKGHKGLTAAQRNSLQNQLVTLDDKIVKATPLFTTEGPDHYAAAYAHNAQFAKKSSSNYQTKLTPKQETEFRAWVKKNHVPFDPDAKNVDYDMRGYWLAMQSGQIAKWAGGQAHFPDTFKTPYDTTFSAESKYATSNNPFVWKGNNLVDTRSGQLVFGSSDAAKLRKQAAAIRAKLGGTTGGVPLLPAVLTDAESRDKSLAKALGNKGPKAQTYLSAEETTLQQEIAFLNGSKAGASAKLKAALAKAVTTAQNRLRTVRTQLAKSITDDRGAELQFAVDQAKDAVAGATKGTAAYGKAVTAEETALRAEIKYLDGRAKNSKLSLAARTKALKSETTDKKELAALLKPTLTKGDPNEAQFLSSYMAIIQSYAPNANPVSSTSTSETHLHSIKNELRRQTPLLKKAVTQAKFPGTARSLIAAGALGA